LKWQESVDSTIKLGITHDETGALCPNAAVDEF